jgi:thiol-disulfide isomerase/thioredoxin
MRFAQLAQIAVVALAAFFVFTFVRTAMDGETRRVCAPACALAPNYAAQNRLAPDFELERLSGGKGRLSDYRGKVVIMNFWTKTCRPCLEELPSLAELGKVLKKDPNVRLITISTDETRDDVRQTLKSVLGAEPSFEVFIDPDAQVVADKYGTKLYPETWFIDAEGVIRARVDGERDWSTGAVHDFASSLQDKLSCGITFSKGRPTGELAGLCGDFGGAG